MGKKKDCFGREDYVCMTPNCPYARECIRVVWEKRLERSLARGKGGDVRRKTRSRLTVES